MLTPKTSFEIHAAAIQQKLTDAQFGAVQAASGLQSSLAELEVTSAQLCAYAVTQSTTVALGTIDVLGFTE